VSLERGELMDDNPSRDDQLEGLELELLLEGVYRHYGFDFRDYAYASLKRRIYNVLRSEGLPTISSLQDRILHDPVCFERFLHSLSVSLTAMFRDPHFYLAFRQKVVPLLKTYPFIRIWHAGCSTGEEVYSMAILLTEEGLYDRCRIYATDMNERVLGQAREGIYPLSGMQEYTANYLKAGGRGAFSEFYTAGYDHVIFRPSLRENVVFSRHNLVTDRSFNEFNAIICRNVMIYFNKTLQDQVQRLLYESLCTFGVLALGNRESLKFSLYEHSFEALDAEARLYRKVG
jgi:chemotaxis protein methyltransferase CheR